jgi:hypothetical protein
MKIRVNFKAPDEFYDAIEEGVRASLADMKITDSREIEALSDVRRERIGDALKPCVEYGECMAVEFDLDAGTATVIRVRP